MQDAGDHNRQLLSPPGRSDSVGSVSAVTKTRESFRPEDFLTGSMEKDIELVETIEDEHGAFELDVDCGEENGNRFMDEDSLSPTSVLDDGNCGLDDNISVMLENAGLQVSSNEEQSQSMSDTGGEEWDIVFGAKSGDKSASDDSMSFESNKDSDDGFDFDSDDEMSEAKSEAREIGPSLVKAFDMNLLQNSIRQGEESLQYVNGKNVILVIGKTGTGKSTLIQGIAGKSFAKKSISRGGTVSKEVFDAMDPVSGFEIGHEKVSMTKHVKAFIRNQGMAGEAIYLDTPGFEDTGGEEVDIATSIMLGEVANMSRSLRFVVMVNYVSLLEDRGGALRSILKVVRNFVRDFKKEKKSFMFVFTHADEIKEVPDSLEGAKKVLLEEIVRTMSGTNDEAVVELLSFIRKSLEKGYPFVDVLHPLKTDYSALVQFIENTLKPTKKILGGNGSSVLTLSSQMRLNGEAQKLLRTLRVLLGRGNVDVKEVYRVKTIFEFFEKYIDFEEMRAAVNDCNELVRDHVDYLCEILHREVDNGTSSAEYFNEVNIGFLKDAIAQLEVLDRSFHAEFNRSQIVKRVAKFQEQLFIGTDRTNFDGYHQDLEKLKTWASFSEECGMLFIPLIGHFNAYVTEIISSVHGVDVEAVHILPEMDFQKLSLNLKQLKSIRENARALSPYVKIVYRAVETLDHFVSRLKSYLDVTKQEIMTMGKEIYFREEHVMENLASQIQNIEIISDLLRVSGITDDILTLVDFVQKAINSKVIERFNTICSELRETDYDSDLEWMNGLVRLRDSSSALQGPRWNAIESSYIAVVDGMKIYLKTKFADLSELSEAALKDGLVDGKRDGECVMKFAKYQWFDDFLPAEEQFVRNCVQKLMKDYSNIMSTNAEAVEGLLFLLSSAQLREQFIDATKELKLSVSVISECRIFGCQVLGTGLVAQTDQVFEKLEKHARDRKNEWGQILNDWSQVSLAKDCDFEQVTARTELLNYVLLEIAEISGLIHKEETKNIIRSSRNEIIASLVEFKKEIDKMLASAIGYEAISNIIARVHALGNFSETAANLPKLDSIKELVTRRVAKDAELIEDKAVSALNFAEIDSLIVEFEKAEILDAFVNYEVSNRLRLLRRLRADREESTTELVDEMIQQHDFASLGNLLEPLKNSSDLIEKSKMRKYEGKIIEYISEIDTKLSKIFHKPLTEETGKSIGELLKILDQAKDDVGSYLYITRKQKKIATKRSIAGISNEWRTKINGKVQSIQSSMLMAIYRDDFVKLVKIDEQLSICSSHFEPFLTKYSEQRKKTILGKYNELTLSIPSKINKFVDSSFRESKELQKMLDGLKCTESMIDPKYSHFIQLYGDSTHSLQERVGEVVEIIKESAIETHCYDDTIEVLKNLKRSLERGLGAHLPISIKDDCNFTLSGFEDIRKQEFCIGIDMLSAEEVKKMGGKLDKLDPNNSWWQKLNFALSGRKTYDNLKAKLLDFALMMHHQGIKALQRRDFNTLNNRQHLLRVIDDVTDKHDMPEVRSKVQALDKEILNAFKSLCTEAQEALQSEDCRAFEPFFPDYCGFVVHVTTLMKHNGAVTSFSLVNQLVYEMMVKEVSNVEEKLRGFDFEMMKQTVEDIRTFGGFIADRFSLFHEQLKSLSHVKSDRWLGLLQGIISKHFQNGRDLRRLKYYAILNIVPSSRKNETQRACMEQINSAAKDSDKLLLVKEAMRVFENDAESQDNNSSKPFDDQLLALGNNLRGMTRSALGEQDYGLVNQLLFNLQGIEIIESLVIPRMDAGKIRDDIHRLVQDHVKKVRIEVDSNWAQRKYQDLNHNIKDLKVMEEKFKSYSHIFATSWSTGIVESVEREIDKLGQDAISFIFSKAAAKQSRDEFRRCFMRMGAVLIELPQFKDFTKKVMSDVLESCLDSEWGYGFVFDLGLSLQRGEDTNDDDEVRIAQNLVTEFGHFKEVLTMVWNEETIQKPAEDTVRDIRGDQLDEVTLTPSALDINSDELLDRFFDFESEYTSLLGTYLVPGADLNELVKRVIEATDKMKPISCDNGFGHETKLKIPTILSGIFALFTILKSGESYNRLVEASDTNMKSKLLMKPHNIQIMTLLCMFGCGNSNMNDLRSQLMQIRTGEGKSMILGAAATVFGLLGFQVRCVCYSEYLSNRDYELFRDVFQHFGILENINYSIITTLSEESTASKGNIREMTLSLMRGAQVTNGKFEYSATDSGKEGSCVEPCGVEVKNSKPRNPGLPSKRAPEEIMLVDEVDVFFGSDFYGQTYNQVAQLAEPEVVAILRKIWEAHKAGGRRLRLADIKTSDEYKSLNSKKLPGFEFVLENEISLMLDQVRRVDEEPMYHLDQDSDRIGYKIQDSISYNVTYGYRTVFAYLKEADDGNLKDRDTTLSRVLTMPISCGQFSYANIQPKRILGVSGTLEVMSDYEKRVLKKYGVRQYLYIPSVYGHSNFVFDKGGDGISIEKGVSDYFQKLTDEISKVATKQKRAVIVFFNDSKRLSEYTSSAFYRKLGRKKEILTENKSRNDKAFVISKAATSGQITLCTAVFGRGTDFFSKDDNLENNGGVHVIQAFLSSDMSEEIQIRGRTARQGKSGSFKMIILDQDLEKNFQIQGTSFDNWPRDEVYARLCDARNKALENKYQSVEMMLSKSTAKDKATHDYFDSLLASNFVEAKKLFKNIYCDMKKKHTGTMTLDLAFAIDITGSMAPYGNAITSTIQNLLDSSTSILTKLKTRFPETAFKLRVGAIGFRDIDDGSAQFQELIWSDNSHFNEHVHGAIQYIKQLTSSASGGSDFAEDHLGAIQRCVKWDSKGDWEGMIKSVVLITDAPAHGYAGTGNATHNIDKYDVRHPLGLTTDSVVEGMLEKDIDLYLCSFDPVATEQFDEELSETYYNHISNVEGHEVTLVPLVAKSSIQKRASGMMDDSRKHNIFVLDESGSMANAWSGVVSVYNKYMRNRCQRQHDSDLISVVQFDSGARVTCKLQNIANAPTRLSYSGGGTNFAPAAATACNLARQTPVSHGSVVIFMSDGMADDSQLAASHFSALNKEIKNRTGHELELHVIGFGGGTDTRQLQEIASASAIGRVHTASDIDSLSKVFVQISGGGTDVASVLEAEISRRISDAVTNRLSAEYFG